MDHLISRANLEACITAIAISSVKSRPDAVVDDIDERYIAFRADGSACTAADAQPPVRYVLNVCYPHDLFALQQRSYLAEEIKNVFLHVRHRYF